MSPWRQLFLLWICGAVPGQGVSIHLWLNPHSLARFASGPRFPHLSSRDDGRLILGLLRVKCFLSKHPERAAPVTEGSCVQVCQKQHQIIPVLLALGFLGF